MVVNPTLCQATRRDGSPYKAQALPTGSYCWFHELGLVEERRQVRVRGGANSAKNRRLAKLVSPRLATVFERLERALEEVHGGTLDPRWATAMASLAGALVQVLDLLYKKTEVKAYDRLREHAEAVGAGQRRLL